MWGVSASAGARRAAYARGLGGAGLGAGVPRTVGPVERAPEPAPSAAEVDPLDECAGCFRIKDDEHDSLLLWVLPHVGQSAAQEAEHAPAPLAIGPAVWRERVRKGYEVEKYP